MITAVSFPKNDGTKRTVHINQIAFVDKTIDDKVYVEFVGSDTNSGFFWLNGQEAELFYKAYAEAVNLNTNILKKANQISYKLLDLILGKLNGVR